MMRLRNTVVAAAGALVLTLSMPNSAFAAVGDFSYRGQLIIGRHTLQDPPSEECINVPGANVLPAHAPHNDTNATATVFLDEDCGGDVYFVMPPGQHLDFRSRFRSVVFS
ncbi:hypothetical protein ACIQWR_28030 [Streptomyces sp. NPDC098789]|uniref:hypothetical protein n=1 Tax=Streptomyces sp. NPDC098789 TaxID=3366098 RepID=UPI0037FA4C82